MFVMRGASGVLCLLLCLLSSGDEILSGFTDDEAVSEGVDRPVVTDVQQEFSSWLRETGRRFSGIGEEQARPETFDVGRAQALAEAFCRSEREEKKGRRCVWSEFQACVTFALRPFSKSYSHFHLEGVSTEGAVREQLPGVEPCTEFEGLPTAKQFANLVAASVPVVFKGGVKHWRAVEVEGT
jgi:hypothetical protein